MIIIYFFEKIKLHVNVKNINPTVLKPAVSALLRVPNIQKRDTKTKNLFGQFD